MIELGSTLLVRLEFEPFRSLFEGLGFSPHPLASRFFILLLGVWTTTLYRFKLM